MLSFLRLVLSLSVLVTVLAACAVSEQLSTPPTDTAMLGGVQAEPSGGAGACWASFVGPTYLAYSNNNT